MERMLSRGEFTFFKEIALDFIFSEWLTKLQNSSERER
jgi:hypothetical protein